MFVIAMNLNLFGEQQDRRHEYGELWSLLDLA